MCRLEHVCSICMQRQMRFVGLLWATRGYIRHQHWCVIVGPAETNVSRYICYRKQWINKCYTVFLAFFSCDLCVFIFKRIGMEWIESLQHSSLLTQTQPSSFDVLPASHVKPQRRSAFKLYHNTIASRSVLHWILAPFMCESNPTSCNRV